MTEIASTNLNIGTMNVIAIVLLISFAIDRIVIGLMFLLSFSKTWNRLVPDPRMIKQQAQRIRADKIYKLTYFTMALILAIVALAFYGNIRILQALNFQAGPFMDILVTGVILVGGSEILGKLLQSKDLSNSPMQTSRPLEIIGKLELDTPNGFQSTHETEKSDKVRV